MSQVKLLVPKGCVMRMSLDATCGQDVSCSPTTEATITARATGTQCAPLLHVSASSQTEEECPVTEADLVQQLPTLRIPGPDNIFEDNILKYSMEITKEKEVAAKVQATKKRKLDPVQQCDDSTSSDEDDVPKKLLEEQRKNALLRLKLHTARKSRSDLQARHQYLEKQHRHLIDVFLNKLDRPVSDISEESSGNVLEASGEVSDAGVDPADKEDAELCRTQSQKNLQRKLLPAEEFQHQVLTRLTVLRMVQQQQGELLMSLAEKVSRHQSSREQPSVQLNSPFRDYQSLKKFDATLTGSTKEAFIQQLASKGGATVVVCTRRLLKLLLTDDLAREFSWFGKKGKHAFSQLRVASCIVSAVKSAHDTTDYDVEAAMREWLRHAPARHKAASKKAQAAQ